MRALKITAFYLFLILSSCQTSTYYFVNDTKRIGVDFTNGKWLLNELDCPKNNQKKLTAEVIKSFYKQLNNRLFYIKDVHGLLITPITNLNPNKTKLKELKDGTGFDFFINIKAIKNKNDLNAIELYQDNNSTGKNESKVILEIYDLNLAEIIYCKQVIGNNSHDGKFSVWQTEKSSKLIDNINFYKTSDKLMIGCLRKIMRDLKKKSRKT